MENAETWKPGADAERNVVNRDGAPGRPSRYIDADRAERSTLSGVVRAGVANIRAGARCWPVWMALAHEDIGDSYKQTWLGPLWLLLNYLLFVGTLLFVFGDRGANSYPVYLSMGLFVWNFISGVVLQSSNLFRSERAFVQGTTLPIFTYAMRQTLRLTIQAGYSLIGAVGILLFEQGLPQWSWLYVLPAFVLILLTAPAMSTIFAVLGAKFPDVHFFMQNFMRLAFFLAPIFWYPTGAGFRQTLYVINPVTYYLEIVRFPLIDGVLPLEAWLICLTISAGAWLVAIGLLGALRDRIVFYL